MVDWRTLRDDAQEIAVWDEHDEYIVRRRKVVAKQQRQKPPLSVDGVTPGPNFFLSALHGGDGAYRGDSSGSAKSYRHRGIGRVGLEAPRRDGGVSVDSHQPCSRAG
jgi:hypothetical protein